MAPQGPAKNMLLTIVPGKKVKFIKYFEKFLLSHNADRSSEAVQMLILIQIIINIQSLHSTLNFISHIGLAASSFLSKVILHSNMHV